MFNNISLNQILDNTDTVNYRQLDFAKLFIWFLTDIQDMSECFMSDIIRCFKDTNLSIPNQTRLRSNLRGNKKDVTTGHSSVSFRLHRNALKKYRSEYANLLPSSLSPEEIIRKRLDVSNTPLLTAAEIENAYKMGQVYVALHCLENSVRNLIRKVLKETLGERWWEKAASSDMKRDLTNRKSREMRYAWLSSRGADELNYMDWGYLVTLIRKYPKEFESFIGSTKFAELKLEELENLRNTIAHNGILPDSEITRIELYFQDWYKQVSK
ncbi:MAG: hypothetical protein A2Y89_07130 [Chloroflexi bacterium RBG_13_51_18]|nr:MAG: hypothetical protein A2Y89_07130 [Chloroflexi bacterium RBG_13_51_18]